MADATHYVEPPRRSPRRGGIRTVAEFRDPGNRFGLGGIVEYTSPGCGTAVGDVELCYPSPMGTQAEKVRDGINTLGGVGPVFGIYAGVECWYGGSDFEADARRLLAQGSDRAIEAALNTWVQAATPETASASISEAIAAAENAADDEYVGLPTLVINRGDAQLAFAAGALEGDGTGNLWTASGTPVLASAEVTAGEVASVGGITVLEGSPVSYLADRLEVNKQFAIAEQVIALIVDCNYVTVHPVTP